MAFSLNGSVGRGGQNKREDVALVQVMLKNLSGGTRYFSGVPLGLNGQGLAAGISAFQRDHGLLNDPKNAKEEGMLTQNGAAFQKISAKFNNDFKDLKIQFLSGLHVVFFLRAGALKRKPKLPNKKDLHLPEVLRGRVLSFLSKAVSEFRVLKHDVSSVGEFCVTFGAVENYYDPDANKIVSKPTDTYFTYVLKKIPLQGWSIVINPDKSFTLKSKKYPFFSAPHYLSQKDIARLKYWNIPTGKDPYQIKLLSSVARPWNKIKRDEKKERFVVPEGSVSPIDKQFSLHASEALAGYGNYKKAITAAYDEIIKRQMRGGARQPLILLFASAEIQVILGISIQVGLLLDPNFQKEYIYIKVKIGLGAAISAGFSAGIDTISEDIEVVKQGGISFGSSFANELSFGPLVMKLKFTSKNIKSPDYNWKGLQGIPLSWFGEGHSLDVSATKVEYKINKADSEGEVLGFKKGNPLSIEGDSETGERIQRGDKSQREKRRKKNEDNNRPKNTAQRIKSRASKLEYSIMEVDIGPVIIDVALKPEASGKARLALGPEVHGDFTYVIDADMDLGWFEDGVYRIVKSWLPDVKPLFPV